MESEDAGAGVEGPARVELNGESVVTGTADGL